MTDNEQVLEGGDDEWAAGYRLGRDRAGLDCWSGLGTGLEMGRLDWAGQDQSNKHLIIGLGWAGLAEAD
ncbi:hypothetical protein PPACK8108_LOCUS26384 [Phakopsora pachyrhizi]|uniref:Uncharacterized protein n=1 Tax=Phakopsora pachyrhizi TaxID=170000 RepID=A0AAV0BTJ6_PHAPC|nr:hypothetical protein PPACK8108_LOCUS26384 [Phakopsora pachyrhizi]